MLANCGGCQRKLTEGLFISFDNPPVTLRVPPSFGQGGLEIARLLISVKSPMKSNALTLPTNADKSLQEKLQPLPYTDIGNGADIGKSFSIIFSTVISFPKRNDERVSVRRAR